jgi:hypothetical protein
MKRAKKYSKPHPRYGARRPQANQMFHAAYAVLNEAGLIDEERQTLSIVKGLDHADREVPALRYEYTVADGTTLSFEENIDRFFDVGMFVNAITRRKDYILASPLVIEACNRMGIHPDLYKAGETVLEFDFS